LADKFFLRIKAFVIIPFLFFTINTAVFPQDTSKVKPADKSNELLQFLAPTALVVFGLTCFSDNNIAPNNLNVYDWRQRNFSNFSTNVDNILVFLPTIAAYSLQFQCVKGRDNTTDMTLILVATGIITYGTVEGLKAMTKHWRPDSSDNESFPSAHTAAAFATADMLSYEYGSKSVWISIAGYTTAATVGFLRILNNKHWMSDVFVGAGIGMFANRISYLLFDKLIKEKRNKSNKYNLMFYPDVLNKGMKFGFQLNM
jgi:hypothetical protein